MKLAMKSHEKFKLSVIRMVRASIQNAEIAKKAELTEDELIVVLNREVKQRKDSLEEYKNANRFDLTKQSEDEIEILMNYMPQQLSEAEIEILVEEAVAQTNASSMKDMGNIMKYLLPKTQGRADGKTINKIVQKHLQ